MSAYTHEDLLEYALWVSEAIDQQDLATAHEAFKPIFDHYYRRIFLFIRSRLQAAYDRDEEARELTSLTMLELWKKLGNFEPCGNLSGLVYTIAERVTLRRSRTNMRELTRRVTPRRDDGSESPDPWELRGGHIDQDGDAEMRAEEAWRRENAARLMEELRAASPEAHRFLELYYDQQLACTQIAKQLGISHDAARFRAITTRLALFEVGWRILREARTAGSVPLPRYRPRTVKELAAIVASNPSVPELFSDYFGAASWHLVKPKRLSRTAEG